MALIKIALACLLMLAGGLITSLTHPVGRWVWLAFALALAVWWL